MPETVVYDELAPFTPRQLAELVLRAALHSKNPLHAAAESVEPSFESAVNAAFALGRKALGGPDAPDAEAAVAAVKKALQRLLPALITKTMQRGGDAAVALLEKKLPRAAELRSAAPKKTIKAKKVPFPVAPVKMKFDVADEAAAAWAEEHAAELITDLSTTTLAAVRVAIAEHLRGAASDLTYKAVLEAVGSEARAHLIARHETMLAANEGQRQAWDQAVDAGLLTGDERRVWIVTPDDKLCEICEPLEDATTDLNGEYPGEGGDGPPAHVNCRCTEGIIGG